MVFVKDKGIKTRRDVQKTARFNHAVMVKLMQSMNSNQVIQSNASVKVAEVGLSWS